MIIICFILLSKFIFPFALGVTFAYLLEPVMEKTLLVLRIEKSFWNWLISIVLILVVLILIFGPILTIMTTAIQELIHLMHALQNKPQGQEFMSFFANKLDLLLKNFTPNISIDEILIRFTEIIQNTSKFLLFYFGNALSATPQFILKFFIFIFTGIFFLAKGKNIRTRFFLEAIPWEKERTIILKTCASVLRALIVSNIVASIIQAFLISIALAVFSIPRYILLGMTAFFLSFIPVIGTIPVVVGVAAWCYFSQGRLFSALGILLCGALIALLDNFIRPYFMKEGAEIKFFWVFLAIICGMSQFGIAGAVIGPVCFALFATALRTLEQNNHETSFRVLEEQNEHK